MPVCGTHSARGSGFGEELGQVERENSASGLACRCYNSYIATPDNDKQLPFRDTLSTSAVGKTTGELAYLALFSFNVSSFCPDCSSVFALCRCVSPIQMVKIE